MLAKGGSSMVNFCFFQLTWPITNSKSANVPHLNAMIGDHKHNSFVSILVDELRNEKLSNSCIKNFSFSCVNAKKKKNQN